MNINNFIIDHVLRGIMTSSADGSYMWSINQMTEPALNITTEASEVVDALGCTVATFNRSKKAEFSANNSLFDLGLFAAQNGVDKTVGSKSAPIVTPIFEEITVAGTDAEKAVLKHTPVNPITNIYVLGGDGSVSTQIKASAEASADTFVYDAETHQITLPTGLSKGAVILVIYEYEAQNAVSVLGDAINFPKAGKFIMEVLGSDACDQTTLVHAYLVFPNAKLDANVDITFTSEGNHPFKLLCSQSYCDREKKLFQLIIPDED